MSSDDFCPRCDHRLTDPAPDQSGDNVSGDNMPVDQTPDDSLPGEEFGPPLSEPLSGADPAAGTDESDRIETLDVAADAPAGVIDIVEPPPDEEDTPLEVPMRNLPTELEVLRVPEPTPDPGRDEAISAPESADEPVSSAAATTPGRSSPGEKDDQPVTGPGAADAKSPVADDPMDMTHPAIHFQAAQSHIPPAPYSPPPATLSSSPYVTPGYAADPYAGAPGAQAVAFIQQRVDAYRHGGYRLRSNHPGEAILTCGKRLGVGGWMLAFISLVGVFWYLLLLVLSGFQADAVYIVLETDGYIYEDGPGAAHTRRHRMRVGRRWAMFGMMLGIVSLVLGIALGIVAGMVLTQERYQAALREAYPAVTLFEEQFSATEAAPKDVEMAKDGAVAFSILAGIAVVGLWGGVTLFVIGTIHAGAYRVSVPPLPGWG